MNNFNESKLEELLKAMTQTKTGAIPNNMICWSNVQDRLVWANVTSNTWEIEVNFDD